MAKILCLETATTNCSVCLSIDGEPTLIKERNTENYIHSEQLHIYIEEVLKEGSIRFNDLDAIAVSKGPGSYTGLRIGVSAAKGLSFSLDIPLISVPTLEILANQLKVEDNEVIIPLLDARRMEVYSAVYNSKLKEIRETRAEVIDENSFSKYNTFTKVNLIGNGAGKCREIVALDNLEFNTGSFPSSREMAFLAFQKHKKGDFEDVAYFEPYYLKDFILGGKKS
ncbi:tRNA (adenosine(37)-N6)-threonylcarbamoyltransferase complex dimerization subunit type 1 TsaB [Croceivirga thetidis]|uniref:tRNA (Adenosine(37)-N6)-threonylcarbamoyltransferase complex dimerization subunit type 1 TsaB n=1 Tax=Croceivirga thetidis TaxID=2721623 RepID=A0ABX1GNI9_9FLAO|nr:tRNA (adenosine(37)-N6)-threonylcarbamoyltransferase complex dimerization subunit type 1 TsaB [Croceivirga thetidis]NKI30606.1 tRNA (adenosine(37)-N6)-threonylcarbamoyltransferase complex dimerization subunit type 1 TsaB [Croceivirga thetidis]